MNFYRTEQHWFNIGQTSLIFWQGGGCEAGELSPSSSLTLTTAYIHKVIFFSFSFSI